MHLAILMTNTDDSAFAEAHPKDGEKFADLLRIVRPDWTFEVFAVKDDRFPDDLSAFDGAMITGSPHSVNSGAPWVGRLLALIREMAERGMPVFGACFGHQAIAAAFGGTVGDNPGGLVHGLMPVEVIARPDWATELPDALALYGSHEEQVTALPAGAEVLSRSPDCAVAGFALGRRIYTTQHHPEMTPDFFAALTDEMADDMGPEQTARARATLSRAPDQAVFAESVARFFEQARDAA